MPDIAYLNGDYCPLEEAKISINDRGLLFGDSVYEVLLAYNNNPFLLVEHLNRLRAGLQALQINATDFVSTLPQVLTAGLNRVSYDRTLIYIQVTRGVQLRQLVYDSGLSPTCIITFRLLRDEELRGYRKEGVAVCLTPDIRWAYRHLKTTNLLANVLARSNARQQGYFEAVLVDEQGEITDGASSTIFIVEEDKIFTPPLSTAILAGVSRDYIFKTVAPGENIEIVEESISAKRLKHAAEVFITATTMQVVPVIRIEDNPIGNGTPGPITRRIAEGVAKGIEEFRS